MKRNVTSAHWALGFGEVRNGKAYFVHGSDPLLCPKNFAFFLPNFSLIEADEKNAEVFMTARVFHGVMPGTLPTAALMFTPSSWSLPVNADQALKFIAGGTKKIVIERLKNPSYLVEKLKQLADHSLSADLKIPEIAFRLKTNPAALAREFKQATGVAPAEYHDLLKLTHARLQKLSATAGDSGVLLKGPSLSLLEVALGSNPQLGE